LLASACCSLSEARDEAGAANDLELWQVRLLFFSRSSTTGRGSLKWLLSKSALISKSTYLLHGACGNGFQILFVVDTVELSVAEGVSEDSIRYVSGYPREVYSVRFRCHFA
jgi:hypothetical protein